MMIIRLLLVTEDPVQVQVDHNGFAEGMDDGETESDDNDNDQVTGYSVGIPHGPRGLRAGCRSEGPEDLWEQLHPVFMNVHVICPIMSATHDEDAENHLLGSNDWMSQKGIAEGAKYGRF